MPRCEDLFITSSEAPDERIHLREKTPDAPAQGVAPKAVLFVHGATYPGVMFDVPTSSCRGDHSLQQRRARPQPFQHIHTATVAGSHKDPGVEFAPLLPVEPLEHRQVPSHRCCLTHVVVHLRR